jgi:transposase
MLAKLLRANELTSIWVPDLEHEAMRDLIRSRSVALKHFSMARHQLKAFLLRHGRTYSGRATWTRAHFRWLGEQKFEQPAQQIVFHDYINAVLDMKERLKRTEHQIEELIPTWSLKPVLDAVCTLKGVNITVGAALLASTGDLTRFATPQQLMAYLGLVPSEHSSGGTVCRGGITKTGNNEARRNLIQAAWTYRFPARVGPRSLAAFKENTKEVRDIAWKAQQRLTKRYRSLASRGKPMQVVATAIARELLGFIWAIGQVTKPA